jgi:GAF domain-containing protein
MSDDATPLSAIRDKDRLEALRQTGLLDTPVEEEFDRLTRLVCRLLGVPVALVSLVEADRQFFKSAVGLPAPWLLRRETSLLHSFCQHVVATGAPLMVQDATKHPLVSDNLAIADLGVVAYLGMPLTTRQGHVLGALCAIDTEPRSWTPGDATTLRDLANMTVAETLLRQVARAMDERLGAERAARLAVQARTQRLESLRRLASSMSHELAGLMQAVQSGVRLVASRVEEDTSTARSLLALLDDVAQRGGALADRLRVFVARDERRMARVDVGKLLLRLARVEPRMSDLKIRTALQVKDGLPEILADHEELQAVLTVLIGAARCAMPEGGTLVLAAERDVVREGDAQGRQLRPGDYVRISVSGSGTAVSRGWPKAVGAAVLSSNSTSRVPSPDIVLALDLVEQLGGALVSHSEPGSGGTLMVWLPAAGDQVPAPVS